MIANTYRYQIERGLPIGLQICQVTRLQAGFNGVCKGEAVNQIVRAIQDEIGIM